MLYLFQYLKSSFFTSSFVLSKAKDLILGEMVGFSYT